MRIFIICSKQFYNTLSDITKKLEGEGHIVTMPNHHDTPGVEEHYRAQGQKEHAQWKGGMFKESEKKIKENDAVLVLNCEKSGVENYIGGATFMEMYDAFRLGKKIFLMNPIPEGILHDEIVGFNPMVIHGKIEAIGHER